MKNCRRRRRSPELPDVVIQHIQTFLKPKESAQTMLISKSWLRAWSTRPFLKFNSYTYVTTGVIDRTLASYVERGMPIFKLQLFVETIEERWLKMARESYVNELHLSARRNWTDTLFQEIFLTKSLQVLNIASLVFKFQLVLWHSDIKCINLRKLRFETLQIDEATFNHIISSCPLIQELQLENCNFLDYCACPLIEESLHENGKLLDYCDYKFAGECASLKRLSFINTGINDEQLQTILSKSPQLEDLNLIGCSKLTKPIYFSSVSLKCVSLGRSNVQLVLIDAPNLRKLKFESGTLMKIPFPINIRSPITKGTVEVDILYIDLVVGESWFRGVREFLAMSAKWNVKFAKSNIELALLYGYPLRTDFHSLRVTPLPPCNEVETLRFTLGYKDLQLLYAFFTTCHPNIVLLYCLNTMSCHELLIELWKDLTHTGHLECCKLNQNKCWRHYIKNTKLYSAADNEEKPLDMNGLEMGLGNMEVITLDLEWEEF